MEIFLRLLLFLSQHGLTFPVGRQCLFELVEFHLAIGHLYPNRCVVSLHLFVRIEGFFVFVGTEELVTFSLFAHLIIS